jgi:hypothetical protein
MENLGNVCFFLTVAAIWILPAWCASEAPSYCQSDALGTESGPDAYGPRGGNRCEGIYRLKLSGGSRRFILCSLTSSRSAAGLMDQVVLVSWPRLPTGIRLRISVVPLDSPILYRMDTEVDGTTGSFQWPANVARGRFAGYQNLGVVAFYSEGGETVHVACALGPVPRTGAGLRADILSLEPLHHLEAFSRPCSISADCKTLESGSPAGDLPGRDRDGTFIFQIPSFPSTGSDFYRLRFVGQLVDPKRPPLSTTVILRAR